MHLWHAPQAVCVLHLAHVSMRLEEFRWSFRLQQSTHPSGHFLLPTVRAHVMNQRVVCPHRPTKHLQCQRTNHVCSSGDLLSPTDGLGSQGRYQLGAIDHGKTLLRSQSDGSETRSLKNLRSWSSGAWLFGVPELSLAHEAQCQMRERRQVPAGTDRALAGNHWQAICVERCDHLIQDLQTDATMPFSKHVDPQCKQHTALLPGKRSTHTTAVRTDQVLL
mmetsp:Transcript_78011/g.135221  ORF Transcript_78011/g.135221 Transcript_78011/m.135221 type:complete len:220 (-) Transcript_78011:334-993(-)